MLMLVCFQCYSSPDPSSTVNMDTFKEWLHSHRDELDDMLREYKAIYFRDFPVANVDDFDGAVRRCCKHCILSTTVCYVTVVQRC